MKPFHVLAGVLAVAFVAAVLAGCAAKVSMENYDKVAKGMTLAEVEGLLGKGEKQASAGLSIGSFGASVETIVWKADDKQITVQFVDGKVVMKMQTGL
jgi:hypothetical protein